MKKKYLLALPLFMLASMVYSASCTAVIQIQPSKNPNYYHPTNVSLNGRHVSISPGYVDISGTVWGYGSDYGNFLGKLQRICWDMQNEKAQPQTAPAFLDSPSIRGF
jgi:hypothetical protein